MPHRRNKSPNRAGDGASEQKSWRNCYKTVGIQTQKPSLFFNFHSPITADADTTATAATAAAISRLHFTFRSNSFSAKTLMVHTWWLWWWRRQQQAAAMAKAWESTTTVFQIRELHCQTRWYICPTFPYLFFFMHNRAARVCVCMCVNEWIHDRNRLCYAWNCGIVDATQHSPNKLFTFLFFPIFGERKCAHTHFNSSERVEYYYVFFRCRRRRCSIYLKRR